MGTSVNLKNRFAGYIIELVVNRDSVQDIMDLVSTQLTGMCNTSHHTISLDKIN